MTLQTILDGMSPAQKELSDLLVGAAVEDSDIPGEYDAQTVYNTLSALQKYAIDFVVGGVLSDASSVAHSDEVGEFLAHHGVKGMRWGVRKEGASDSATARGERQQARAAVRNGAATLGAAHTAALKSTGHRVTNALLGDKRYWVNCLKLTGITAAAIGAAYGVPKILPDGLMQSLGESVSGTHGVGGHILVNNPVNGNLQMTTNRHIGELAATSFGISAATAVGTAAGSVNAVGNTVRAARGNARIRKNAEALGARLQADQVTGSKKTQDILVKNGGLRRKDLNGDPHVRSLSPENDVLTQLMTRDNAKHSDETTSILTAEEKFLTAEFLEHHGVKGMKWGIQKSGGSSGSGGVTSKEAAKAHNHTTDLLVKGIKSATNEAHVEDVLDRAHLNGLIEDNIKVSNIDVSPNGKKIRYEIKAYRMTPGKTNDSAESGLKVEHITKEVGRLKPGFGRSHADEIAAQHSNDALVDDFLTHHGVKGMKWGVQKSTASVGSATKSAGKATQLGSDELRRKAAAAGKLAFTVAKIGAPTVLVATGVGVPIAASLGVSMRLISDPQVRDALSSAGQYTKSLMPDIGSTSLSDMKKSVSSSIPKPFSTDTKVKTPNPFGDSKLTVGRNRLGNGELGSLVPKAGKL